jgi:integrase
VRIYDAKTRRDFNQSLRTTNRVEALSKAEMLYAERRDALRKGIRATSINTKELIRIYINERAKTVTTIPHQGITKESLSTLIKQLDYWQQYINAKKQGHTKIEDIPPDTAKGFGIWMKELDKKRYTGRERSNETINHAIAAVKKMYREVAIDEKYITMAEFPIFRYLKVNKEKNHKRDIIEPEEFLLLQRWMRNNWRRERGISDLERIKRSVYCQYLAINYLTGCRNKEMLGIRWGDVAPIKHEDERAQKVNRGIFIPAENSKTGKSRTCVAPVAVEFNRIKELYRKIGIDHFGREDYVFINLANTKRGSNIPYDQPAMENRLKAVIEGSGLKKILEETGRHITQYSARHYAATDALMRGVSIYDVAVNLGTSVHYIEQTYSKITALKKSAEITKGQGLHGVIERLATEKGMTYEITSTGNIKVGGVEYNDLSEFVKLHYNDYYARLSSEVQREDDYEWLEVLKLSGGTPEEIERLKEQLSNRWSEDEQD